MRLCAEREWGKVSSTPSGQKYERWMAVACCGVVERGAPLVDVSVCEWWW